MWKNLVKLTKYNNYTGPLVGVATIVQKPNGKILLGKRKGSHGAETWAPPGGKPNKNESMQECASRELFEETGINIRHENIHAIDMAPIHDRFEHVSFITLWYFCEISENTDVKIMEPDKCSGWIWATEEDCSSGIILFPPFAALIDIINPWRSNSYKLSYRD